MTDRIRSSPGPAAPTGFRITRTQVTRAIVSLIIATLLWGWITQINDPIRTVGFNNFPIEKPELSNELTIVTALPQVNIDLEGPQSTVNDINRSEISVRLDTSDIDGPGNYSLGIVVNGPSGSYREAADPDTIDVRVEQVTSREFPLTIQKQTSGQGQSDVADVVPDTSQVTVSGPSSAVDRVQSVVLPVPIDSGAQRFRGSFEPFAVDANNQRVAEVTILPSSIGASVTVNQPGRTVSVIADITGQPADGFSVQQRTAIPENIVVDGPKDVIDSLLFVNTEPVDVTGASTSVSRIVGIRDLPEGVKVISPASGQVEVRVAIADTATQSETVKDVRVSPMGLPADLEATVEPATVDVVVSGQDSDFTNMAPGDVRAYVDLTGYGPGTYTLMPSISAPKGVTWVSNAPNSVRVTVRERRGTPQSTPVTQHPVPSGPEPVISNEPGSRAARHASRGPLRPRRV